MAQQYKIHQKEVNVHVIIACKGTTREISAILPPAHNSTRIRELELEIVDNEHGFSGELLVQLNKINKTTKLTVF